jgi:hypothetical protein
MGFECDICTQHMSSQDDVARHIQLHQVRAPECGDFFWQESDLHLVADDLADKQVDDKLPSAAGNQSRFNAYRQRARQRRKDKR